MTSDRNKQERRGPAVYAYLCLSPHSTRPALSEARHGVEEHRRRLGLPLRGWFVDLRDCWLLPAHKRPQLRKLLATLRPGDVVLLPPIPHAHLGARDLLYIVQAIPSGVRMYIAGQEIDLACPLARALLAWFVAPDGDVAEKAEAVKTLVAVGPGLRHAAGIEGGGT